MAGMTVTALVVGIFVGCVYALVALGIVLIYKTTKIFNLAQGEMLAVGAWVTWSVLAAGLPLWLCILIAIVFSVLLGMAIERLILRPMLGQPLFSVIMVTIGIVCLLRGVSLYIWGGETRAFPEFIPAASVSIGFIDMPVELMVIAIVAVFLVVGTYLYFRFSRAGLAMRVTAEDAVIAQSLGINVKTAYTRSWVLSAIAATAGGVLIGSFAGMSLALTDFGFKAFPVIMLGGFESIPGVLVAGPTMGICEYLGATFLDPLVGGGIGEVIPYIVMLIVLLVKPYGLFGYRIIERV